MKLNSSKITALAGFILSTMLVCHGKAALIITPSDNASALADTVLGPGITLVGAPVYSADVSGASGGFTGGLSAGLGINTGLILTTGLASSAPGPNNSPSTSGAGATTSLSFNFTTVGGDLFFNYVFASEEYNEYVNAGFNDFFELRIDGVNVALVPGTATPVSIDNVNNGLNSAYYNNNENAAYDLQYDGFTTVLRAEALGIGAGEHTVQFLVSDIGDSAYDSAVFIQGGSFSDTPIPPNNVPEGGSTLGILALGVTSLASLRSKFKSKS